jgi:hypothetical protein
MMFQDGWTPTNDSEITALMKLLAEKQRETDKIVTTANMEIAELEAIGKEVQDSYNKLEHKINELCKAYVLNEVDKEDRKETPTTIKYKIARGEIVINKAKKTLLKPSEKDVKILQEQYPDFVKSDPIFQWGEFKKDLDINDEGQVINKKSGKVVENVPVVDVPQTVSIKLAVK